MGGGCEKGFEGPLGASGKLCATAVEGVEPGGGGTVADNGAEKGRPLSANASWIEGKDVRPTGDSFSSLVERRVVDSGGEMYPEWPCAELFVGCAYEYGGGGPEYSVFGLARGALERLRPFIPENRDASAWSVLILSRSRWLIGGSVLAGVSVTVLGMESESSTYLGLLAVSTVAMMPLVPNCYYSYFLFLHHGPVNHVGRS